jgi:BMFP domain-containing protein YqiC
MQTSNKLLDDLARVASGVLGVAAGMREEVESAMRQRFARVLGDFDLVTRDEFEAVKAMAVKARTEEEALKLRIVKLEAQVAQLLVGTTSDGTPLEERMPPAD